MRTEYVIHKSGTLSKRFKGHSAMSDLFVYIIQCSKNDPNKITNCRIQKVDYEDDGVEAWVEDVVSLTKKELQQCIDYQEVNT